MKQLHRKLFWSCFILISSMFLFTNCTPVTPSSSTTGSAKAQLKAQLGDLIPIFVDHINVTVKGDALTKPIKLQLNSNENLWKNTLANLPADQNLTFTFEAYKRDLTKLATAKVTKSLKGTDNEVYVKLEMDKSQKASEGQGGVSKSDSPLFLGHSSKAGGTSYDGISDAAVDSSGNSYLTGFFLGTCTFGGTSLVSSGATDGFIAKYSSSGSVTWAIKMSSSSSVLGDAVAVDSSGNVYVSGSFKGTLTVGSSSVNSAGGFDVFTLKLNSSGGVVWLVRTGGTADDIGAAVDVNSSGDVFIAGRLKSSFTFASTNVTPAGNWDAFVAKYNSSGAEQAITAITDTDSVLLNDLTVASDGNVHATGEFYGTVAFGSTNLTSQGSGDLVVVKLNSSLAIQSAAGGGSSSLDSGADIKVSSSGDIYVAGYQSGASTFGSVSTTGQGQQDGVLLKLSSAYAFTWAKVMGSTANDGYNQVSVGTSSVYAAGSFSYTVTINSESLTSAGGKDAIIVKYDLNGNEILGDTFGGTGEDLAYGLHQNTSGEVFVAGRFQNTVVFKGESETSSGNYDIFNIKLTDSEIVTGGNTSHDSIRGMAKDSSGNTYIVGVYKTSITFGGTTLNAVGNMDGFIVKYNSKNEVVWARGVTGSSFEIPYNVTADSSGNVYVVGAFLGTMTSGGSNCSSAGSFDQFIAKLDSSGNTTWLKCIGSTGIDVAEDVALDPSGNVYYVGRFAGTVNFDSIQRTASGNSDGIVVKLNSSGTVAYTATASGPGADTLRGIGVDSAGNAFVAGQFYGTANFGAIIRTSKGLGDIVFGKVNSSGTFIWAYRAGGQYVDSASSLALDSSNNAYITGYFRDSSDFDSSTLSASGAADVFVTKLNANGVFQWTRQAGGTGTDYGWDIAVSTTGVVVTGSFESSMTVGNALTSAGASDAFIAEYTSSGTARWSKKYGGTGADIGFACMALGNGEYAIGGYYSGTATFGSTNKTSAGDADIANWRFTR